MKILISAAEASSDAHGAELLKAIQSQVPVSEGVEAFGMGGPHLQAAGLRARVDARELLSMGFGEILGRLPRILRAIRELTELAEQSRPDVVVVIDYPDFHFRLARRLKRLNIPMVYYIPPKVWAWRRGRVEFLRRFFSKILCILPFEEKFYHDLNIPAKYVGNPLVDELPLNLTRAEARKGLGLKDSDQVLVMMPGSRPSEFKHHLVLLLESAQKVAEKLRSKSASSKISGVKVLMPLPRTVDLAWIEGQVAAWKGGRQLEFDVMLSQGNAGECLVAADAGLVKSGTSTLEAGLLRCPHVVFYQTNWLSEWIFKHLIRYRGPVGLVNLAGGWRPGQDYLVPELLCENVTKEALAHEVLGLLGPTEKRQKMMRGFEGLRKIIFGNPPGQSPSEMAAREVIGVVREFSKQGG